MVNVLGPALPWRFALGCTLLALILVPQPGEVPIVNEPEDPAEDDHAYWLQLRRARGWPELPVTAQAAEAASEPVRGDSGARPHH